MTDDETAEKAVWELEPDDVGSGTVQANGMLYVGREHADADVRWVIERDENEEESDEPATDS